MWDRVESTSHIAWTTSTWFFRRLPRLAIRGRAGRMGWAMRARLDSYRARRRTPYQVPSLIRSMDGSMARSGRRVLPTTRLQVDVAKRVSHGIQFHGAYTWGKSIDTLSATEANDAFPNGLFNQLFFDQQTSRGLSDFNVAQTLVLSATWEIPGPEKARRLPKWAFGGWQLVALYKASTGQPFTPIMGGDPVAQNWTRPD